MKRVVRIALPSLVLSLVVSTGADVREFRDAAAYGELAPLVETDPGAAWAALEPLRGDFEGDPAFDMLLAQAALGIGEPAQARLALERVQFIAPDTPRVRELLAATAIRANDGSGPGAPSASDYAEPELAADEIDRSELARLDERIDARAWAEAYDIARSLLEAWEGDPGFDYLYGIAALEAGYPEEALFALQRVLFFDPAQIRVRAQLARAHFVGGDLDQAEAEFRRVLAGTPPETVAGSIRGYLAEIDRIRNDLTPRLVARVGFATGYDDNVNSATTDDLVVTPIGNFALSENGRALGSGYTDTRVRLVYEHPISRRRTVDLMLATSLRHNFDQHDFDLDVHRLEAGYAHAEGTRRLRGAVRGTVVTLGSEVFQNAVGAGFTTEVEDGRWRWRGSMDATVVRYPDDSERDVAQALLSLGSSYLRPLDLLTLDVFGGREVALEEDGEYNGRDLVGLAASWQRSALPGHVPYIRYRILGTRHHADHPVFAERREDLQQSAALGWNWFLSPELSARAEFDYTETRSSLDLFEHDRLRVETGLSYSF